MRLFLTLLTILLVSAPASSQGLVGVSFDSGFYYSVSPTTGATTYLGDTGLTSPSGLELAPNGTLYAFTAGSSPELYSVDQSTGAASFIGPLGIGFVFEGGMAISNLGVAYCTNQNSSSDPYLFSVDLSTGAGTVIGPLGSSHDINGLVWRSDGLLVGIDRVTNSLVTIHPGTAALSILASLTPRAGSTGGMTIHNGVGFFTTGGAGGTNELWTFDLFTGAHNRVGPLSGISSAGMSGLASLVPIAPGLTLSTIGVPGGTMTFDVSGATPVGPLAYIYAQGTGAYSGLNPFTGNIVTTGLSSTGFSIGAIVTADGWGNYSLTSAVPARAAGWIHVQSVDLLTDAVSNVVGL